jgi:glycosyltransferase involved in cell wall biosynthesis
VTPSYNQAQFLEETIRSVLLQGYPDLEYFVMDGGSTDDSAEVIRKYEPWLAGWVSARDGGQADAINKGFAVATGAIVGWVNSDDLLEPGAVAAAARILAGDPEAGVAHGGLVTIDDRSRITGGRPAVDMDYELLAAGRTRIVQPGSFWRREIFDAIGMLDASMHFSFDYDFYIRASRRFPLVRLDRTMSRFRVWGGTKTSTQWEVSHREVREVQGRNRTRWRLASLLRPRLYRNDVSRGHLVTAFKRFEDGMPRLGASHLATALLWDPLVVLERVFWKTLIRLPALIARASR